ncbi:MAG TPA: hypothetical protein VND22_09690 [Actinomycetota bacterium]|nr:hypothetical protein [Actinomycetota bacterium]
MRQLLRGLVLGALFVVALTFVTPALAADSHPEPAPSASPTANPAPPGERNLFVGALAVGAILVTAGAGMFLYRTIRKGI